MEQSIETHFVNILGGPKITETNAFEFELTA